MFVMVYFCTLKLCIQKLLDVYEKFNKDSCRFDQLLHACKKHILCTSFTSEVRFLARQLQLMCADEAVNTDWTTRQLQRALVEYIAVCGAIISKHTLLFS